MIKWIKENKRIVIFWVIIILVVVPLIIYLLSTLTVLPPGLNNDWAGFWGGYLGAIIGGLSTLIVFKYTVSYNNGVYDKDKRFETSKTIIKLSSTYNFQIANVIKVSNSYVRSFSEEDDMELLHACNLVGNASQELSLSMLIYEKQYPQLKGIFQEYNEIHQDYKEFIQYIDQNKVDIFADSQENQAKLASFCDEKSKEILDKLNIFSNVISEVLKEFI
ncbi:hypothetical protein AALB39_26140 [Lachnospiraceae bacterium 54-53]